MTPDLLRTQYDWIKQSRGVVFRFLEMYLAADLAKSLTAFKDKSICYMYGHIANTYIAWAGNFALNGSHSYYDQDEPMTLNQLQGLYTKADEIMERFNDHFAADPSGAVKGHKWPDKYIETDAYGIFTHVITHEFHQIQTWCVSSDQTIQTT